MTRAEKITELREQKRRMLDYLQLKVAANDYHGVVDAAMDIREINAQLEVLLCDSIFTS